MSPPLTKGHVRNGKVETDEPIDLPDLTELLISVGDGKVTDTEDGRDTSPEGIAACLRRYDSFQPL